MARTLARSAALLLVLATAAQAAERPIRLDEVAALGPNTVVLSAEGSAGLWLARNGVVDGCVRPPFQERCSGNGRGEAPIAVVGRDVYVADGAHARLVHWRRHEGQLRYAGVLRGVDLAERMVVADGGRLLAVSTGLGRVVLLRRAAKGRLERAGCLGARCGNDVLPEQSGLWVAATGRWLIASGRSSITVVDARTLARADCVSHRLEACRPNPHTTGDIDFGQPLFAVGPDLYSADYTIGGIGMAVGWWRISVTGRLRFGGCLSEGSRSTCRRGSPAIADPEAFAVSGGVVAIGGTTLHGIAVLHRNRGTGALRFRGVCVTPRGAAGCSADPRVAGVSDVEIAGGRIHAVSGSQLLTYDLRP